VGLVAPHLLTVREDSGEKGDFTVHLFRFFSITSYKDYGYPLRNDGSPDGRH